MKTVITTKMKGAVLAAGLGLLSFSGFSQEHITLSLENITTTSNTIEYDLFVTNDGTTALKLSGCAFGVNYNGVILNGGSPSDAAYTPISGSRTRDLSGLKSAILKNTNRENFNQLRLTTTTTPRDNAANLLANVPYKVGRFKFTNTTAWTSNSNPSITLNEYNVPGISTSCATAYVGSELNPKGFSVAKKNLSVKVVSSPILNPSNAPLEVAQTGLQTIGNNVVNGEVVSGNENGLGQLGNSKISIYPNPTQDILNIDLTASSVSNTVVKVLDIRGRIVKQIQARSEKGLNSMTISLHDVTDGVYTVQVYQNNELSFTDKLTKKN